MSKSNNILALICEKAGSSASCDINRTDGASRYIKRGELRLSANISVIWQQRKDAVSFIIYLGLARPRHLEKYVGYADGE